MDRRTRYKSPFTEEDVLAEHEKINSSDAIAFIYPVFWTEAPAKLVGWFDRVWTYGFAYGDKKMKMMDKAMILCSAGNPIERLEQFGLLASMKKVMFGDRLFNRAKQMEFVVFDGTSREKETREGNWDSNLEKAYEKGKNFFARLFAGSVRFRHVLQSQKGPVQRVDGVGKVFSRWGLIVFGRDAAVFFVHDRKDLPGKEFRAF